MQNEIKELNNELTAKNADKESLLPKLSDLNSKLTTAKGEIDTLQNDLTHAKNAYEEKASQSANKINLSQSYIDAIHNFTTRYENGETDIKNTDEFVNTMRSVSDESYSQNHFVHNDADKERQVDVLNLTPEQDLELQIYTINLLNDVRTQLGVTPLVLNNDARKFAKHVASNYMRDNRSNADGNHHDVPGIEDAARNFGLDDDGQYYENMSGFWSNSTSDDSDIASNKRSYDFNSENNFTSKVSMDNLKDAI